MMPTIRIMSVVLLGLVIGTVIIPAASVQYTHDELVWTKRNWDNYKLDFPWSQFQHREAEANALLNDGAKHMAINTLAGPQENLDSLIKEDLERSKHQPGSFMVSALDDMGSISTAATVSQCRVCSVLAHQLWEGLVSWVNANRQLPTTLQITDYAENLCNYEVPVEVLKEWVILQAKIKNKEGRRQQQPPTTTDDLVFMEFYLFSQRQRQHATPYELAAVTQACIDLVDGEMFIEEDGFDHLDEQRLDGRQQHQEEEEEEDDVGEGDSKQWGDDSNGNDIRENGDDEYAIEERKHTSKQATRGGQEESSKGSGQHHGDDNNDDGDGDPLKKKGRNTKPLIAAIESQIEEYYKELISKKLKESVSKQPTATQNKSNSREKKGNVASVTSVEDELAGGPLPQRECFDKHPQCEFWARLGECRANPKYMVGTPYTGHCRKACKECEPPKATPLTDILFLESDVEVMMNVSTILFTEAERQSCLDNVPCNWANSGKPVETLRAAATDFRSSNVVDSASFVAGPLSASTRRARVETENQLMKQTQIVFTRNIQHAIVPTSRKKGMSKATVPADVSMLEKTLWNNLRDTCLYMNNGWWSYEVCYQKAITQFHMDSAKQQVDWVISLGNYQSTDWKVRRANDTALFPPGTQVPYISQHLTEGNHCDLDDPETEPEAVDGSIKRQSIARFMCSPDGSGHITVEEPQQCRYVVDVYLPRLCDTLGMEPSKPQHQHHQQHQHQNNKPDSSSKGGRRRNGASVPQAKPSQGASSGGDDMYYYEESGENEQQAPGVEDEEPLEFVLVLDDDEYEHAEL